jgi:aspartate kinase
VRVLSASQQADAPAVVLSALAELGVNLELVVQTADADDGGNLGLVVAHQDLERTLDLLEPLAGELGAKGVSYVPDVAVVSVFGPHLREKPKIPGRMFTAIAEAGVTPLAVATSISSVSCVVEGPRLEACLQALAEAFDSPGAARARPKGW